MKTNEQLLSQFYTNDSIAKKCVEIVYNNVNCKNALFIEPSAGTWVFLSFLPKNTVALDIDPKNEKIIKQDFMDYIYPNGYNITIWNPPFWKNSSLALKFLNKAWENSNYVCFILPKTFKKKSFQNKILRSLHLIYEEDLPMDSFNYLWNSYNVPCVFQIWEKRSYLRERNDIILKHQDFNFVRINENPDFAIRRVWVLAWKIILDTNKYSPSSHYYIKCNIDKDECIKSFQWIDWSDVKFNTAGNPSIWKSEIINHYDICQKTKITV